MPVPPPAPWSPPSPQPPSPLGPWYYAVSKDGIHWSFKSLRGAPFCKWPIPAPDGHLSGQPKLISNGKWMLLHEAHRVAICAANDTANPSFAVAQDSRQLGRMRTAQGIFFATTLEGLTGLYYSRNGQKWSPVEIVEPQCVPVAHKMNPSQLGVVEVHEKLALLFIRGSTNNLCLYPITSTFNGKLLGGVSATLSTDGFVPVLDAVGLRTGPGGSADLVFSLPPGKIVVIEVDGLPGPHNSMVLNP
eukprot:TRINITY_DN66783_c6_g1_i1.p2 TRINITY_DN66783_c6_g1~~TRINITY_DN66783_c6_g1_i1.p2  ORF type:complete len:259 (-),score=27.74 TRINITY_DN66783_c6_g1_i1:1542-2279(-)